MKQNLLKTWLMLVCLLVGAGSAWADSWQLVSRVSDIEDGQTYLIATNNKASVYNGSISSGHLSVSEGTLSGSTFTAPNDACEVTLVATSTTNTYYIKRNSDNKYITVTGNKSGSFSQTGASGFAWTFANDATDGLTVNGKFSGSTVYFRSYNNASLRSYANTSGNALFLYKKVTDGSTPTKYNVNIAKDIQNGTVTASPTSAEANSTITLTATPTTGYEFSAWNVTNASTSTAITVTDNKFTMPAADVNVSASFTAIGGGEPTLYTVTLGDNSASITQTTEGGNVTLPTREGNETYTFAGWSSTNISEETTTAPTIIAAGNYKPTANVTLYPVYKRVEGKAGFLLYETVSGTTHYMKHDCTATTSKSEADAFNWGSGYLTYKSGEYTYYISHQESGSTKLVNNGTSPTNYKWNITDNTKNNTLKFQSQVQTTRYLGTTGSGFKAYAASHTLNYEAAGVEYYISSLPAAKTLSSISVKTAPAKVTYTEKEKFDPSGLIITATYEDASSEDIAYDEHASDFTFTPSIATVLTADINSVTITYKEKKTTQNITVNAITDKTIAEFIANEGGMCYLTGIVSNIDNSTYGNFDLTDESGTIYIYGCLTSEGVAKQFSTLGIESGDKIKILANEYELYSEKHEAKNVIFVEKIPIEKPKYTVTIETPENGTLIVKEGENVLTSGDQVEQGKTLIIECNPTNEDYRFKNWQAVDPTTHTYTTTFTYEVTTADVTIKANFELIPVYTIAWSVNGTIIKSEDLKEGAAIVAPAIPDAINKKVFTGWIETATVEGEIPVYVTPSKNAEKTVTYYAVFATQTGSADDTSTIELTNEDISKIYDSKSTSYKDGTIGDWSFKGAINQTSDTYYVQMNRETSDKKSAYNSHLSTPVCPAPIKSITIATTNNTANGRTFILTNSATVGAATTDGEGVYGYGSLTEAAGSVTIKVSGKPTSLHIYPHGGAVYVSNVVITYGEDPTYSDFTTTPSPSYSPQTLTLKAKNDDGYYATFSSDKVTFFPEDYIVSAVGVENGKLYKFSNDETFDDDIVEINGKDVIGYYVPANTGVLLYSTDENVIYQNVTGVTPSDDVEAINMLVPTTTAGIFKDKADDYHYYKLAYGDNTNKTKLGFWFGAEDGSGNFNVKAGGAVLCVPQIAGVKGFSLSGGDETAIENLMSNNKQKTIYNLQGVKLQKLQKGVNIVNGRKVIR